MVLRVLYFGLVIVPFTLAGLPVQLVILGLNLRGWAVLPRVFFRLVAFGLGLRVRCEGAPVAGPVLLVANHIGWLDIVAIASKIPLSFVAKSEIATAPLVGAMAKLQRTIFIARARRTDTGRTAREMRQRLAQGHAVLLFAEGTSGVGTHVLAFRSALLGAASAAMGRGDGEGVAIQPMAIAYTKVSGLPVSRLDRRHLAWIGDMGVGDTLGAILRSGPKDVVIAFGTPLYGDGDRKAMARAAHAQVRQMLNALNRGHPLPKPGEVINRAL